MPEPTVSHSPHSPMDVFTIGCTRRRVDDLCREAPHLADLSPALDDGHSQYVSGVPLVGGDLQCGSPLREAAGGALGACREFLK